MRTKAAVLTVALSAEALLGAQQRPSTTPRAGDAYSAATTAILVDVVVRDKRGRPSDRPRPGRLRDLRERRRADGRVLLGRRQRASGIGIQVKRRTPGLTTVSTAPGATPPDEAPAESDEQPPTTAIVFDSLTPEALSLAQRPRSTSCR